jgi:AhpD family alkylhydroperoxidase
LPAPRIPPGRRADIGLLNALIIHVIGAATGGQAPRFFPTLARNRRLFRRWLRFALALMPGGGLPRAETELVILRVAHNCRCDYQLRQHEPIALGAGLTQHEVAAIRMGSQAPGWSARQVLLLTMADELHHGHTISPGLWERLAATWSQPELIELCLLVGHYEMLAMTLNALAVQPDAVAARLPSRRGSRRG